MLSGFTQEEIIELVKKYMSHQKASLKQKNFTDATAKYFVGIKRQGKL